MKEHLILDPDDETPVSTLSLRTPCVMHPQTSMFDALNLFQTGHSHMALITTSVEAVLDAWKAGVDVPPHVDFLGVCTIEDVIEELIGEEILDEGDQAHAEALLPAEQLVAKEVSIMTQRAAPAGSDLRVPLLPGPR